MKKWFGILPVLLGLLLGSCTFLQQFITPPAAFVSFFWREDGVNNPDLFLCDVSTTLVDVDSVQKGLYYPVSADDYTLIYGYTDGTIHIFPFTVEEYDVVLGKENSYYDIYLTKSGPTLYEFPGTP